MFHPGDAVPPGRGQHARAPTPLELIGANPLAGYPDGYSGGIEAAQAAMECADCESGCADCGELGGESSIAKASDTRGAMVRTGMGTPSADGPAAELANIRHRAAKQLVAAMSLLEAVAVEEELARPVVRAGSGRN